MLFVHSTDLQPFALVLRQSLVLFVHSLDLQPFAQVLSQELVLFVHSMDLQPFALVLSQNLVLFVPGWYPKATLTIFRAALPIFSLPMSRWGNHFSSLQQSGFTLGYSMQTPRVH